MPLELLTLCRGLLRFQCNHVKKGLCAEFSALTVKETSPPHSEMGLGEGLVYLQGGAPSFAGRHRGSRRNRTLVSLGPDLLLAGCACGDLAASVLNSQEGAHVGGAFVANSHASLTVLSRLGCSQSI